MIDEGLPFDVHIITHQLDTWKRSGNQKKRLGKW